MYERKAVIFMTEVDLWQIFRKKINGKPKKTLKMTLTKYDFVYSEGMVYDSLKRKHSSNIATNYGK